MSRFSFAAVLLQVLSQAVVSVRMFDDHARAARRGCSGPSRLLPLPQSRELVLVVVVVCLL
eukprot:2983934-Alexandrium_andersonii.AAC.1